jgi:glucose/arabinose dehydrogenase
VAGFERPLFITAPPGDTSRVFVVEQPGTIKIVQLSDSSVLVTPFLDITDRVEYGSTEQGLLGMAFHPDFANNGYFYLNYTNPPGAGSNLTRISRFQAVGPYFATATSADPDSEVVLLTYDQPQGNHNGGMLAFEPRVDGKAYLYIAAGDGGGAGDQGTGHNAATGNGQDVNTLLGKILRIDVDEGGEGAGTGGADYDIPPTNPNLGGVPEIWAYGLRNPYRFSFDRNTGDLYIGDVGQNAYEEVDFQPASSSGGENYGWRLKEGDSCYNPSTGCDPGGLTDPVHVYDHANDGGRAVIGGYVFRGGTIPFIEGHYIFADVSGIARTFLMDGGLATLMQDWATPLQTSNISSFGEDANGEIYFSIRGTPGQSDGAVYKIVPTDNDVVWVDFAAAGLMKGNETNPLNTLDAGVRSVADGGTVTIVGDSTVTNTGEQLIVDRPMTITSVNGTVSIGAAARARSTRPSSEGFVPRQ